MPIIVENSLPACAVLESENIFVMTHHRATTQHIRPLRIAILNLMPTKIVTETQILRCLSNTPIQIEIDLIQTATHKSTNTPEDHLLKFYQTFDDIKDLYYDGFIITGAPVEKMDFEEVDYWPELVEIMEWTKTHVHSTLHICWGAQAGLYYHYGIQKHLLPKKLAGIYKHHIMSNRTNESLLRGFDDVFKAPHSRYTTVLSEDILCNHNLILLAESYEAGPYLIAAKNGRQLFVTGHSEYDKETLAKEYFRDLHKGIHPDIPENYFDGDDPHNEPRLSWRSHSTLLFTNWLNYYVYQSTPYELNSLI